MIKSTIELICQYFTLQQTNPDSHLQNYFEDHMTTIILYPTLEAIYQAAVICNKNKYIPESIIISRRAAIARNIEKAQRECATSTLLIFAPFDCKAEVQDVLNMSPHEFQIKWHAGHDRKNQSKLNSFRNIHTYNTESLPVPPKEIESYLRFKKALTFLGDQEGDLAIDHIREAITRLSSKPESIPEEDKPSVSNYAQIDFPAIEGESPKIVFLKKEILRVAKASLDKILLLGETGTGKEAVAFFLHALDPVRKSGNFGVLNCAALQEDLLISELFGHEKGSFTGATQTRKGLVSELDRGTLFLDELPDLPPRAQTMLLRFLESGTYTPLGSNQQKKADVKIISAGQRSLLYEKIKANAFRLDLYYRLAGKIIQLPSLSEIPEDIETIIVHLAYKIENDHAKRDQVISYFLGRIEELKAHTWPGNVRELANYVTRKIKLGEEEHIDLQELGHNLSRERESLQRERVYSSSPIEQSVFSLTEMNHPSPLSYYKIDSLNVIKKKYVKHIYSALSRSGIPQVQISKILGISINTLKNTLSH